MRKGFVIGKFMPLHKGHVFMLEIAEQYCDELTILVDHFKNEQIDVQIRKKIIERTFPSSKVTVKAMPQKMPQDPAKDENFWPIWTTVLKETLDAETSVVIGAMDYIKNIAKELNIDYLMVDKQRNNVPISATEIRNNPYINWHFLALESRPLYVKKIVIVGGESTGKTTLTKELMQHFNTNWIPEYARTVAEENEDNNIEYKDFIKIIEGQRAVNNVLTKQAIKVVFQDTDFLTTQIWAEKMLNHKIKEIEQLIKDNAVDLYILLPHTLQWEKDSTRFYPDEEDRRWFTNRFREELKSRNLPFVEIDSSQKTERLTQVINHINKHFPMLSIQKGDMHD